MTKTIRRNFYPMRLLRLLALCALFLTACGRDAPDEPVLTIPTRPPGEGTPNVIAPTTDPGATPVAPTPTNAAPGQVATPTLAPPATPAVAAIATAVTDPPILRVDTPPLPAITRDLLFIAEGALKLWNQRTRQIEILYPGGGSTDGQQERLAGHILLANDITSYSVSADGRTLVAAHLIRNEPYEQTAAHQYELLLLNLENRQSRVLVPDLLDVREVQISPDGRRVAFTARPPETPPEETFVHAMYLVHTGDGRPPARLAACAGFCSIPAWHPENNLLVWGDTGALWLYNMVATRPERLLDNQSGAPADTLVYTPISWASNGRFLLLWEGRWEGGSRAVFDVPTRTVMPVPDSFVYAELYYTEVTWMRDDRLLALRQNVGGVGRPRLELWRAHPDRGELVQEESKVVAPEVTNATAPAHLEDGRFAYVLTGERHSDANGFYWLTSFSEEPERVNAMAPVIIAPTAAWSPDGAGAVIAVDEAAYYAPAEGDYLYDVQPLFGRWARAFHWLPPRPPTP